MVISFAGHSAICSGTRIKEIVKSQIVNKIPREEKVTFYLGGYGAFDEICAQVCRDLRKEYKNIELVYVTPYISLSSQRNIKEMQRCGLCDTAIYPPLENVQPKFAISKRNEWMIANSDIVIVYISHSYGGAYNSFKFAQRKKKKIINVFDLI